MNASGPANESEDGSAKDFTSFRPKDNAMSKIGNQVEWARPIFFVHGHDDFHSQVGNVINLNARDNQGFSAVAMKV